MTDTLITIALVGFGAVATLVAAAEHRRAKRLNDILHRQPERGPRGRFIKRQDRA